MKHLEHFHELKSLTRKQKFFLLSLLPVYFMVIGLFLQPIQEIGPGIVRLIKEPDFLITDYFVVGGVGAALINAGALTLMSIGIIYFMGMDMDGHTITSSCLMFGFSLFGKTCLTSGLFWPECTCTPGTTRRPCAGIFILAFTAPAFRPSSPR